MEDNHEVDEDDVPPLEDLTPVLKKIGAIKEECVEETDEKTSSCKSVGKDRARVVKNAKAQVVQLKTDSNVLSQVNNQNNESNGKFKTPMPSSADKSTSVDNSKSLGGMFGGMKKGFLFGNTPKISKSGTMVKNKEENIPSEPEIKSIPEKKITEDIPYISPETRRTQSGLTIDEVQQAMSESKGLLENQEWINDDLLNKLEKNEFLIKRFCDLHFMKALQEFQTNPQAAMEKYKSNKEVERFLLEFCGLLGDHFTNIGSSSSSPTKMKENAQPFPFLNSATSKKLSEIKIKKTAPKITEVNKQNTKSGEVKNSSKIVEIAEDHHEPQARSLQENDFFELNLGECPKDKNDTLKVKPIDDQQVKELLNDPKVMEILLDTQVMNLIQTMKTDPIKAHRLVENADQSLRDKIVFLVGKHLLDFQVQ